MSDPEDRTGLEVAVVGLAGRFPGARDVAELWRNLLAGVDLVAELTVDEVVARGVDPALAREERYVKAAAEIAGADLFDADFFEIPPREAELIDPQHRVYLECCAEALEDAGIDPSRDRRPVGVFGGSSVPTYVLRNVLASRADLSAMSGLLGSDKDHLTTLVSWKLDLSGPSFAVQAACSTSLVAIHLAAQSLLNGECDAALAGGVSILFPQGAGYLWTEGGIFSPDGRCRSFEARGAGTIFGSGAGVVVLKRLDDAIADGDRIRAVIKGSAVSNDGASRSGYTVPSAAGQARAIRAAQLVAEVPPGTIGFVEAHGTGTQIGDPIEFAALAETFAGVPAGQVALGAVKSNVGHLNSASGVASFIKAVLAVESGEIPGTLHFERPNPQIPLAGSPFFVNSGTVPFPAAAGPRRAAVSAYGMGGTNAHAILEEAPAAPASGPSRARQVLTLSAKTATAAAALAGDLARHLEAHPELPLADVAYSSALGRRDHFHRRAVVAGSCGEAAAALAAGAGEGVFAAATAGGPVHFLFPGQGSQHVGMAAGLYAAEPIFRAEIDSSAEILREELPRDLREVLFAPPAERAEAEALLERTEWAQPALFAVEHALANLWAAWGIEPQGMLGHGLGEYVAACLAGVFAPADALRLVALRGRLMASLPPGAMLEPFEHAVAAVERKPPALPFVSGLTGRPITAEEVADPAYWARHLRGTVRFADGLAALAADGPAIYLEVGPGNALGTLARRHPALAAAPILATLRHPKD